MTSYLTIYFDPQPDITTAELAHIFARVGSVLAPRYGISCQLDIWESMTPPIKRHFTRDAPQDTAPFGWQP